ncbi:MAG: type II secretion system F family protein [Pirellulaceae bacterium]|nr:type II secretion system F family protein [Pirellulaceae bacterium]
MNAALINVSLVFAAGTSGVLALGLVLRDLLRRPENPEQSRRLSLLPPQPTGGRLDLAFYRMVEESGLPLDSFTALLIPLGGGMVGLLTGLLLLDNLLAAATGLVLGCTVPLLVMAVVRWWRVGRMRKELPDALQIVADSIRAGQTLEEAFDLTARDMKGPLSAEFAWGRSQLQLGHAPLSIMARMVRRIPLQEFRVFATAVVVHRRAGGNLSLLTERMAKSARERQELRGHMLAATAGSRLSAVGMIVGSIIAMCVLGWLEPEYVAKFFEHRLGPPLLAIAIGLQLLGTFWVWRVVRENY